MNNRDWERLGEDILRTVQDAVESCNYDRLNQTVGDAVNQVVDGVARNVRNMKDTANQRWQEQARYGQPNYQQQNYRQAGYQQPAFRQLTKNPSKVPGIMFSILGFGSSAMAVLIAILLLFVAVITGGFYSRLVGFLIADLSVLAISALIGVMGMSMMERIERFKRYLKEIGNAEFCNIKDMASRVRKSNNFVIKDLEKMIKKGWFLQGHFDKQKTCIILTDQMYEQYKQLEKKKEEQKEEQRREAERKTKQSQDARRKGLSPEVQKVIEQGDAYVKKIRECNDAIPGEEISAKIYRMEEIVDRIFDRVEQNPDSVGDIRKLMEYYLPTTVKLLEAYAEMDAQPVGGENIRTAKNEIEATLDTLNVAFEKLLDSLFQDAAWDVSSDISVLNTILAQEGLKEDGLRK